MQGGVLSHALLLPTSFFPVETSQSRRKKGGLQTTVDLASDSFNQMWVFMSVITNQAGLTFFFAKKKVSKEKAKLKNSVKT